MITHSTTIETLDPFAIPLEGINLIKASVGKVGNAHPTGLAAKLGLVVSVCEA
jgi:hypothetical protein